MKSIRNPGLSVILNAAFIVLTLFGVNTSARSQTDDSKKYPIHDAIANKNPVRGVYVNYTDFLVNNPSIRDSIVTRESHTKIKAWRDVTFIIPYYAKNLRPLKKVWGFSDGTQCYIAQGDDFFPIELQESDFIFYGFGLGEDNPKFVPYVGGGLGGLGAGVMIPLSSAVPTNPKERVKYLISPQIGTYMRNPTDEEVYLGMFPIELVVYRRSRKEKATNTEFLAHDSLVYSFQIDSYVMLRYPKSDSIARLCVGADFTDCISVPLSNDKVNYVEINLPEQAKLPSIIIQEEDQGEFDFAKIEGNQDRRGRQEPQIRVSIE